MLARVKQNYAAGPVTAFSGHEYVRNEWREVPAGFEEQAKNHPLLDTQPSPDEIRAHGPTAPGLAEPAAEEKAAAVTVETAEPQAAEPVAEESPAPPEPEGETKTTRKRKRAAEE